MKYTCSVLINQPMDMVVAQWEDSANFAKWQDGFVSFERLNGEPNTLGATSKFIFKGKLEPIELVETILIANVPAEKKGLYEHKHMSYMQSTRFLAITPSQTKCECEVEYVTFNGAMVKLIATLFPSRFKQQSQQWLRQFKVFSEGH